MTANRKTIEKLQKEKDDENLAGSSTSTRISLESRFFISHLRFEEAMLNSYKLFEAVKLAYVYAKRRPPPRVQAEFRACGVEEHHWAEWTDQEHVTKPHNVIIALQMTGGEALHKDIHKDNHEDNIAFGIPT